MRYEALVKIGDNVNDALSPEEAEAHLYKDGDIVVVRPEGWAWGRREVKEFLIVTLPEGLTEQEAQELESEVSVQGAKPKGNPHDEPEDERHVLHRRRRYQADVRGVLRQAILSGAANATPGPTQPASAQPASPQPVTERQMRARLRDPDLEYQPVKGMAVKDSLLNDKTKGRKLTNQIKATEKQLQDEGYQVVKPKKVKIKNVSVDP